ncbi:MAG TPA: hypothetical protein VHA30_04340 [Patescibacteria group bacterium]|nr:hypothetical protein [Patescibacteria group bacterium]
MQRNNFLKIAAVFLLAGQLLLPALALAQISVPVSDSNTGNSLGGVAGTAANATIQSTLTGIDTASRACATAEQAYEKTDSAAQLGFSGLAIIGGDSVLLAQLQAKITAYNGFITCRQGVLDSLKAVITPNVFTANLKQQIADQQNAALTAYKQKLEQVQARYNNAKQGFWKTLVFNILIKTSKSVADALVTKLVNNYKIRNYVGYADSLATLMYDNQFLRQNFPDAQGQLMARAVLENPLFRNQIPSAIFVAADQALGFNPSQLDPASPNFYTNLATVGSTAANPYFQHSVYVGGVNQAHATALAYAQNQISQSNGYKAPVTCAGSLAQQQFIDAQNKAALDKLNNRSNLLANLQSAQKAGQQVSASDLAKAQADYTAAYNSWNNLPDTMGTSSPAIIMCEAVSSPANLVNQGIDQAFNAIGVNMAQYNNNNLPAFMNIIGSVASQIGSSFILGGSAGAKGAALINEGTVVNAAVQAGTDALYSNVSANLANGVDFEAAPASSGQANTYTLSWNVITAQLGTASFATVSGPGIAATTVDPKTKQTIPNKLPLSGSANVTAAGGGNYILTVFDASGKSLTAVTLTITPPSGAQALNADELPHVLGASTIKAALQIRGPTPQFTIR